MTELPKLFTCYRHDDIRCVGRPDQVDKLLSEISMCFCVIFVRRPYAEHSGRDTRRRRWTRALRLSFETLWQWIKTIDPSFSEMDDSLVPSNRGIPKDEQESADALHSLWDEETLLESEPDAAGW